MEHLSDIRAFVKVVRTGSFSAAAAELGLSQSTVSKHVSRLEQTLNVQLLNRSTRQLSLTEAGADFHARATRILEELEEACRAVAAFNTGLRGSLRVHSTMGIGRTLVIPAVSAFMDEYKDLFVQVILTSGPVNIIEQHIDVTVRLSSDRDTMINQTSLAHRVLGTARYVICGSPDYFRRAGMPTDPAELVHHNCIAHSTQPSPKDWQFIGPRGIRSVRVSGTHSSNDLSALRAAVLQGVGLCRLLEPGVREELKRGELRALFSDITHPVRPVIAYFPRTEPVPEKIRVFLDCLEESFKPLLAPVAEIDGAGGANSGRFAGPVTAGRRPLEGE